MTNLSEILQDFNQLDDDYRLDLLIDYAEKLPPLPPHRVNLKNNEKYKVPECQTPVFISMDPNDNRLEFYAEVAEESLTAKGIISILVNSLHGRLIAEVELIPLDLLQKLGLSRKIGSLRTHGISAIIHRINNRIKELKE
jgi:cysteine desulfuration protein SufE